MKLYTIETGNFRLDGGAMFGVVPKVIWNKVYPADDNNLCNWAMRCLLVEDGDRLILIDNGLGDTFDAKYLSHYYLNGDDTLEKSLSKHGFKRSDITDMFLTHLHFDHCGGNVIFSEDKNDYVPAFPNAQYWVSRKQYESVMNPNAREKASYFKRMILPVEQNGQLSFIEEEQSITPNISLKIFNGHTEGQMLPFINYNGKTVVYMADLLPATVHIPMPWIMAFDMSPLITLNEKEEFLKEALEGDYILFFEHDIYNECCTLQSTEKGIRVKDTYRLGDLLMMDQD